MIIHLYIVGVLLMLLATGHLVFPRYFKWKAELSHLSRVNQQIMKVHTFFIALAVFLMGALCLYSVEELVSTSLGRVVCTGLAIFWTFRLLFQFFVYSPELWRGKAFEFFIHIIFSFVWVYLSLVFWVIGLGITFN